MVGFFGLFARALLIVPTAQAFPQSESFLQLIPSDEVFDDPSIAREHSFYGPQGGPEDDLPITHRNASHYPVVRLPYASYRPAIHNKHDGYVVYKNVRYARAPTGTHRFAAPAEPETTHGVQDGSFGHSCHQAVPNWMLQKKRMAGLSTKEDDFLENKSDGEDCLFLDVAVPENHIKSGEKAPVLVWIYGGGFAYGKKDSPKFRPSGFFQRAAAANQSIVYAAINYRLGAFGFLGGPDFTSQGGQPNAGLHDQRYAIEWIQEHISKFGGDPERITVMGESAGASSILHHLTWADPEDKEPASAPFDRAILQSPCYLPIPGHELGNSQQDKTFHDLSRATSKCSNVTSSSILACLQDVASEDIVSANRDLIFKASEGTFLFGPVVDNQTVPDLPMNLFQQGKFNKDVRIMTTTVGAEGLMFVPTKEIWQIPDFMDSDVEKHIQTVLPHAGEVAINDILEKYPYSNNTFFSYGDLYFPLVSGQARRLASFAGETFTRCNSIFLNRAYANATNHPVYSINFKKLDNTFTRNPFGLPALHGTDVAWTFFNGYSGAVDPRRAKGMQNWILGFAVSDDADPNAYVTEDPDEEGENRALTLTEYGKDGTVVVMDGDEISEERDEDDGRGERCGFWQEFWKEYGSEELDEGI